MSKPTFYKQLGISPACYSDTITLSAADSLKTKYIMWFWIVLFMVIALGILVLDFYWFKLKISPYLATGLNKILSWNFLVFSFVLAVAIGAFVIPAIHYLKLLYYSLTFNKNSIAIKFRGKLVKKYKWNDIKAIKWHVVDKTHYDLVFKDGFKYPLPHWPVSGLKLLSGCILKHKPNLTWQLELYLRDIYF